MPRLRATRHRHALHTVVTRPMPSAASTDPASTDRSPSTTAVAPSRQTSATAIAAPPSSRSAGHSLRVTTRCRGGRARRRARRRCAAHRRRGVEPAAQVGACGRAQLGALLAGRREPAPQPLLGQLGIGRAEPPRARRGDHLRAAAAERRRGRRGGVRPEQPPAALAAPLVGVEGAGERGVEGLVGGQRCAARHGEREQRGAPGRGAGRGKGRPPRRR